MGKSSRSKKGQPAKQTPPETVNPLPGADMTPSNDKLKDDDFEHALPAALMPPPAPIQWPPAPPPPKVTIVPPLPKPVSPPTPPPLAATAKPTAPAPAPAVRTQTIAINAHNRVNLGQIVAYRLDKPDAVVMIGADGVQYHARGEYAAAIRNAIGVPNRP